MSRVFVRSLKVNVPVQELFAFHERPDALELLSPPFPPLRVERKTGGLEVGSQVELRIAWLTRWVALHTAYEKDCLFVDEQRQGPFAEWVHRHEFEADGTERSILTDRVRYALPGGALVNGLLGWAVELMLRDMFSRRHRVTKELCEAVRR